MDQIIEYIEAPAALGKVLVACQEGRVTNVILGKQQDSLLDLLKEYYPQASPDSYKSVEGGKLDTRSDTSPDTNSNTRIAEYLNKIINYLSGNLKNPTQILNDIPITFPKQATEWQIKLWTKMRDIPHGKTVTYGELAENAGGDKKAAIAVGGVCSSNRIAILIPCHRVLAAKPSNAFNYRWGTDWKRFLLDLESKTT